jgi:hypothetical protein
MCVFNIAPKSRPTSSSSFLEPRVCRNLVGLRREAGDSIDDFFGLRELRLCRFVWEAAGDRGGQGALLAIICSDEPAGETKELFFFLLVAKMQSPHPEDCFQLACHCLHLPLLQPLSSQSNRHLLPQHP